MLMKFMLTLTLSKPTSVTCCFVSVAVDHGVW